MIIGSAVDANDSFETPARTLEVVRHLQNHNIESFETPIPQADIAGYQEIKRHTDIPITTSLRQSRSNRSNTGKYERFIYYRLPGLTRCQCYTGRRSFQMPPHLPVWIQIVGLGITTSYVMHLAAVMPNATMPAITLNALRAFDLVTPSTIPLVDGYATIPDKPGLGVELDEDALDNCRVLRRNRMTHYSKTLARNGMECGFKERISKSRRTSFNRKI